MKNQIGLIDGRYAVINGLGRGGFGTVYLVKDTHTAQYAALKFLSAGAADALERFHREARLLTKLRENRYVVKLLGQNLNNAPPYVVLEYCEGGSLRSWVNGGRSWQEIAAALVHVVLGLHGIHEAGGFHRDLKPDNLLVTEDPQTPGGLLIKIADWGLARGPGSQSVLTRHGAGTPGYIAPEIVNGGDFDARADIYSLGVVAAELLTGQLSSKALGAARIPEQLRGLIRKMLSPEPSARPHSRGVAQTLQTLLNTPNVPAVQEQSQDEAPGIGTLIFGGLLVGGAMMALAALVGGETGGGPAKPGAGSLPKGPQ